MRHLDEERSNQRKHLGSVFLIGLLVIVVMVSACAHQPLGYAPNPPGFWVGIWNGATIGFSMIGHLFDQGIRIYAFPNSGGWYDFGYVLGVGSWGAIAGAIRSVVGS